MSGRLGSQVQIIGRGDEWYDVVSQSGSQVRVKLPDPDEYTWSLSFDIHVNDVRGSRG